MIGDLSPRTRGVLAEKIAASVPPPETSATTRRVYGRTRFPGKATARSANSAPSPKRGKCFRAPTSASSP